MAKNKTLKNKNVKKDFETEKILKTLNTSALDGEKFLQKYTKPITILFGVIVLGIVGYVVYNNYVSTPKKIQAANYMVDAKDAFEKGDLTNSLSKNNSSYKGFKEIAQDYKSVTDGKLANLYAGKIQFENGKYQDALNYFENFDSSDNDLLAIKYGAIADTYVQLNNDSEALKYMEKAANQAENGAISFHFYRKSAILAISLKNNTKALEMLNTAKTKYPEFDQKGEVEALIEYLNYKK